MANVDNPRGLWPVRHATGGEIRSTEYTVTTGSTIYPGDQVKLVTAGTVQTDAASGTAPHTVIGVAATYADDSGSAGGVKVQVYDDPQIIFGIQCLTGQTPALASVGASSDVTLTAANTTYKRSNHELSSSGGTGDAQMKIVGLIDTPGNAWGEHADLEVRYHEHYNLSSGAANAPI